MYSQSREHEKIELKMRLGKWTVAKGLAKGVFTNSSHLLNIYDVLGTVEMEVTCRAKDKICKLFDLDI